MAESEMKMLQRDAVLHVFSKYRRRMSVNLFLISKRTIMTTLHSIEGCKANAARRAVDDHITGDCIVGVGSGSTITYVLNRIIELCKEKDRKVRCVPTSKTTKELILQSGLPLSDLDSDPELDVAIDGADEVDKNFVAIKGGGRCHTQEKVVAFAARKFIVVADHRKDSKHLGEKWTRGIPIEVIPMSCSLVRRHISKTHGTNLENVDIRQENGVPVVTDNGNFVLDWKFDTNRTANFSGSDWSRLTSELNSIPGVVEVGIFADLVDEVYFGCEDGSVDRRVSATGDSRDGDRGTK